MAQVMEAESPQPCSFQARQQLVGSQVAQVNQLSAFDVKTSSSAIVPVPFRDASSIRLSRSSSRIWRSFRERSTRRDLLLLGVPNRPCE